ncbi:MAG: hypothetical protein EBY21_06005 [Alphaproteobacteria bacterium]|nr:hypothetical protein [Alphaproteobacteria bacterium]
MDTAWHPYFQHDSLAFNLITAQRDRVVGSYALVSAIGRLSASTLGLQVSRYDPKLHFDQVKDIIWGVSTPDGR